ncbi:hypothetical protein [Psychrobacter immobilis]|uniref:hypothetical protein n=1 Tax=Psychrobacter immobilis TaxID=498 RepID=UPI00191AEF52|nr:hypothetical protein [Psychrobacter immobilis]
MSKKPHTESTSADKTALGFDFQYYFFILKLLYLKPGESVGLEVLDDVHTTNLDNNCQIYYQVKHTIHENTKLRTRDPDLWKTLSNWSKVIVDKNDGRDNENEQLEFLKKSEFVLFSNKLDNEKNEVINLINSFKQSSINLNGFISELESIKLRTKSETITAYINDLLSMDQAVLEKFILKINFELGKNDILPMIYEALKGKMVDEKNIEDVFRNLDSDIRKDNFITIKLGKKFEVSFDEFYAKYKIYFQISASKLPIRPLISELPSISEMKEQIFIKQLLDIKDFESDDIDRLTRLTTHMLKLEDNIFKWFENGEITHNKYEDFHSNTKAVWENILTSKKRRGLTQDKSLDMIDELRKERLVIDSQELDTEMSNGEFYYLSNIPEIGWTLDWEKYKK